MTWDRTAPTDPKYRTPEHRAYCAQLKRELRREGYLTCTADRCLFGDRTITNPNGNQPDGLTAGHDDTGTTYTGPQHRRCNVRDGAVRASARSHGTQAQPRRWPL